MMLLSGRHAIDLSMLFEVVVKNAQGKEWEFTVQDLARLECVSQETKKVIAREKLWTFVRYLPRQIDIKLLDRLASFAARGVNLDTNLHVRSSIGYKYKGRTEGGHDDGRGRGHGRVDYYGKYALVHDGCVFGYRISLTNTEIHAIRTSFPAVRGVELIGVLPSFHMETSNSSLPAEDYRVLAYIDFVMRERGIASVKFYAPDPDDENGELPSRVYQWTPGSRPSLDDFAIGPPMSELESQSEKAQYQRDEMHRFFTKRFAASASRE